MQEQQQQEQQGSAPVGFRHAIDYVTKIKRRFVDEKETYKQFLDILRIYKDEQRSIEGVLDQVSHLFRDHPDLLREFAYFLPEAVQGVAKKQLERAAARSKKAIERRAAREDRHRE